MFTIGYESIFTFGGWDGGAGVLNDLWSLDAGTNLVSQFLIPNQTVSIDTGAAWNKKLISGSSVSARFGHCGCAIKNKYYTFGGMNAAHDIRDIQVIQQKDAPKR